MTNHIITLGLHGHNAHDVAALGETVGGNLQAPQTAAVFKNMPVAAAAMLQASVDLRAKLAARVQARQQEMAATQDAHKAEDALRGMLQVTAKQAEIIVASLPPAEVEPAVVALGLSLRAKAVHHKDLPTPDALSVTVSDEHGAVDWHCHGSPHRKDIKGYSLETGDPAKPGSFKQAAFSSKSKGTVTGLPSGVLTGFRVVIVGTDDRVSTPSNVVTIFVP